MLTDKGRVQLRGALVLVAALIAAVDLARTLLLVHDGVLVLAVAVALYLVACCIRNPANPAASNEQSESSAPATEKPHDG